MKLIPTSIAVLLLALAATPASAGTLLMHREAVVTADAVRVSDLCRLDGFDSAEAASLADVVVATAPQVGATGQITVAELRSAVQAAGANLATLVIKGAARCDVSRPRRDPIQPVTKPQARLASAPAGASGAAPGATGQTLRAVIESFLAADLAVPQARVEVQYGRVEEALLDLTDPPCTFEIRRTTGRRVGLVGLEVTVRDAQGTAQSVPLLVNVSFSRRAVVAARGINQDAVIGPTDVKVVEMTFTRLDQLGLDEPEAVIGQRARKFIPAGQLVTALDIEPVPLVKRGQIVSVESQAGGVSIVSVATALGGGTYGDIIELRSGDRSKREFTAQVVGPGRVRIDASAAGSSTTDLAWGGNP